MVGYLSEDAIYPKFASLQSSYHLRQLPMQALELTLKINKILLFKTLFTLCAIKYLAIAIAGSLLCSSE